MGLIQSKPQHLDAVYADDELSAPLRSTFKDVEHLFLPPQRLKIEEDDQVGVGGYGEVMLATLDKSSRNSRKVAVKQLRAVGTKGDRKRLAIRLARELKIWATLQHPNILGLLGYYLSENYEIAQLISAYMVNGNVSRYLNQHQPDIATRLKFVQDITAGLQYLHSFNPPICHGDLKPANVLISDEVEAIICDFGVASFVNQAAGPSGLTTTRALKGSMRYMSPELLLEGEGEHTLPSDIWARACTTYEILTGIEPYSKMRTNGAIIAEMVQSKVPGSTRVLLSRFPQDETWPTTLSQIIRKCWSVDSSKRPSVTALIEATKYVPPPPSPASAGGVVLVWAGGQSQTTPSSISQSAATEPTRPDKGLETDGESPPRKSADERGIMSDGEVTIGGGSKDLKRRMSTRKAVMESGNALLSAESEERAPSPLSRVAASSSVKESIFPGSLGVRKKRNNDEGTANGSASGKTKGERLSFFGGALGKGRKPVPRYGPGEEQSLPFSPATRLYTALSLSKTPDGGVLRNRAASSPPETVPSGRRPARPPPAPLEIEAKPGMTALDQIGQPDHSSWMQKREESFNAWKLRYFVLKGPHLYYVTALNEAKIKGYINITGYQVIADEDVYPGRYGFKIVHDTEKPHYFSSVEQKVVREWMRALMKATIWRDYSRPVVSSCNIPTIPLSMAQTMNPPPRPPSPTARAAAQKAMRCENPNQLPIHDAFVRMGMRGEPDSTGKAHLDQFFRSPPVGHFAGSSSRQPPPLPPRPSRELRRAPNVRAPDAVRDSSNSASDMELISWINNNLSSNVPPATDLSISLASGLILYRLAESIKGLPTDVPDSVFDIDGPDGMFKLFDFMLDNDVRIGNVLINDVRRGNKEKITEIVKNLKSWQEKREELVKGMSKQPPTAGPWLAVG